MCGVRADDRSQLVGLGADRDADQQHARHHHLAGGQIAELEQLAQDLAGLAAQQPAFLALLDDELQLLGRVITLGLDLLPLDADQAQQPVADRVQRDDQRQDAPSRSAAISGDTYSTVLSARCSASAFGTISPITMCR